MSPPYWRNRPSIRIAWNWSGRCRRIRLGDCFVLQKLISNLESLKGQYLDPRLYTLWHHSTEQHDLWIHYPSHISMLTARQLYESFTSGDSAAALTWFTVVLGLGFSQRMSMNKWNWTQIKLNSSLSGTNDSRANSSVFSYWAFRWSKLCPAKYAETFATNIWLKVSPSAHMYCLSLQLMLLPYPVICGVFTITLIWKELNYLQLLLCLVSLNYCKSLLFSIADTDLTKLQMCSESTGPRCDKVTSFHSQCSTASFPSLVASKI